MSQHYSEPDVNPNAPATLEFSWGREWHRLSSDQQAIVAADFSDMEADEFDGVTSTAATEYRRRIGRGNLESYARTLLAGAARRSR